MIYSGTVAAAMEGRFLGLPAIAVSLVYEDEPRHFETAAEAAARLVEASCLPSGEKQHRYTSLECPSNVRLL